MDAHNFSKSDFSFPGIHRGIVEDNADPLDLGRVKIRIYEIHNLDGNETSIDNIPWATPALGLSWSGGYNVYNKDHKNETPDVPGNRYDPGSNSKVSGTNQSASQTSTPNNTKFSPEEDDSLLNSYGTGGQFVVPKRGNWVFLFFEGGNHMNPVYFAMAPAGRDWDAQKNWRTKEIKEKTDQIAEFRKDFKPRKKSEPSDSETWAPNTIVNALVDQPKLVIPEIQQTDSNRDIFCTTSAQGTTVVIDNRYKKERIYVIHKNFIDFIDENGNKKLYAGKSRNKVDPGSLDPNEPSNYEIGIEGTHELFVGGNYNVYAKGDVNIQVDGNAQIDVKKNVGIVSREGDIDLIVETGNFNADIKGNADINIGKNANIKVNEDANLLVKKNMKATINGSLDAIVNGNSKIQIDGDLDTTVKGTAKINSKSIDITSPDVKISGNVHIGGQINVTGDANITGNCKVQQVVYAVIGADIGGYLYNRGLADLGGPVIAHQLIVTSGVGRGTGRTPARASTPTAPETPTEATHENGVSTDKENLKNLKTPNEQ